MVRHSPAMLPNMKMREQKVKHFLLGDLQQGFLTFAPPEFRVLDFRGAFSLGPLGTCEGVSPVAPSFLHLETLSEVTRAAKERFQVPEK